MSTKQDKINRRLDDGYKIAGIVGTGLAFRAGKKLASSQQLLGKDIVGSSVGNNYQEVLTSLASNFKSVFDMDGSRLGLVDLAIPCAQRSADIILFCTRVAPIVPLLEMKNSREWDSLTPNTKDSIAYNTARKVLSGSSGPFADLYEYKMLNLTTAKKYDVGLVNDASNFIRDTGAAIDGLCRFKGAHRGRKSVADQRPLNYTLGALLSQGSIGAIISHINTANPNLNVDFIRALNVGTQWVQSFLSFKFGTMTRLNNLLDTCDLHWFENRFSPFYAWAYSEANSVVPYRANSSVSILYSNTEYDGSAQDFVRAKQVALINAIKLAILQDLDSQ